ncbi:arginine--tRNA ligase [Stackebrandtia nassauensis]|uniref:Arginine--tRNA ligase n=1 Tax=Stackebrandtia nassauensis (strain DSM 44728 / CIP 108903 / NRRL B-16338 / NBRC 102104 / LLR-40K-21) TaxID=446470 RepID=D3PUD4_STANL|nr:arginyl-tRNA synthetase [Stackebrandtia nassauensis DSM 44728]
MVAAIRRACPQPEQPDAMVRRSDHADFQTNGILPLAKQAGQQPRDLAVAVVDQLDHGDLLSEVTVASPGFVNITVTDAAVWRQVEQRLADSLLGLGQPEAGSTTVVDYSAPNVAKQMHVGHLRSTVIGDALARLLEALGATVIRQNHLGDWGTQFGMLIQYLDEHPDLDWHRRGDHSPGIDTLDALYRAARAVFDTDTDFADRSRKRVVALQSGDAATVAVWRDLVRTSMEAFNAIYRRLGVSLTDEHLAGESSYNPLLADVVSALVEAGIAVESDGALCVFDDRFTGHEGQPIPLIVRKRDGGFGYAATDLATIRHRAQDLGADRVLYLVDARQSLHFRQVFAAARRAGWLGDDVEVRHVPFGTVLGADGKPFKTRSGGTVALTSLLDAAVDGARAVVADKNPELPAAELDAIAEAAGIGAVKYADLSTARGTDYRFNVDKMVALNGNTGVYLQYAHTRIASILRKSPTGTHAAVHVDLPPHPAERVLALHLDDYSRVLADTVEQLEPHRVATYLFELAKLFSAFYENCPVLSAADSAVRGNRLALTELARRTLSHGLCILGITALERM